MRIAKMLQKSNWIRSKQRRIKRPQKPRKTKRNKRTTRIILTRCLLCVCCRFDWAIKPAPKCNKIRQNYGQNGAISNIVNWALFPFVDRFSSVSSFVLLFSSPFEIDHVFTFLLIASHSNTFVSRFHALFVYSPLCLHWKTIEAHKKQRFIFISVFGWRRSVGLTKWSLIALWAKSLNQTKTLTKPKL